MNPSSAAVVSAGLVVKDLETGASAASMANALTGTGVTLSNVQYLGEARAAGTFTGGTGIVGFESGIVLDTGHAQTRPTDDPCAGGVEGPNVCYEIDQNGVGGPDGEKNSTSFLADGDSDLDSLSGGLTEDAAVLLIDFTPTFSTVQFNYVFASEEYSDYSLSDYNDVFGFFVNGANCALVPGTNLPVSVNTINNGNTQSGTGAPQNPQYFVNNVPPTLNIELDGLTKVLSCRANVQAGVTNTLKLAIADTSDAIFDSAVFIQAQSLSSGTSISTTLSGGGQLGSNISVPVGTPVTATGSLSGTNAGVATGTVTYSVYSDAACETAVSTGSPRTITTPGTLPASLPVTLNTPGQYYWRAVYSGDSLNNGVVGVCGVNGAVATAALATTTTTTTAPPTTTTTTTTTTTSTTTTTTVPPTTTTTTTVPPTTTTTVPPTTTTTTTTTVPPTTTTTTAPPKTTTTTAPPKKCDLPTSARKVSGVTKLANGGFLGVHMIKLQLPFIGTRWWGTVTYVGPMAGKWVTLSGTGYPRTVSVSVDQATCGVELKLRGFGFGSKSIPLSGDLKLSLAPLGETGPTGVSVSYATASESSTVTKGSIKLQ